MGSNINKDCKVTDPSSILFFQLQKLEDLGYKKIWKNRFSNRIYEEYTHFDTSTSTLEQQFHIYQKRKVQELNLVEVHYVENVNKQYEGSCCREFRVFTQHIPYLLSEFSEIPLTSAIFFLKKAFLGYQALFKEVGFFEVFSSMMGINSENQPRVWLNRNWAANIPMKPGSKPSNAIHLEGKMVEQIFLQIESFIRMEEKARYSKEKVKIQQWTFELAHAFISYFVQCQDLCLPDKVTFKKKMDKNILNYQLQKKQFQQQNENKKPGQPQNIFKPRISMTPDTSPVTSSKTIFSQGIMNKMTTLQSPHYRYETPGIINFSQKKNFVFNRTIKNSAESKSLIKKCSLIDRNKINNSFNSKKSLQSQRFSHNNSFDFSWGKKNLQEKVNDLKFSKDTSQKTFLKASKASSFLNNQGCTTTIKNSGVERQNLKGDFLDSDRKLKTQSTILKSKAFLMRKQKPQVCDPSQRRSSVVDKSKISSMDSTLIQNRAKESSMDSSYERGWSLIRKSKTILGSNFNSVNKNWLGLSQQLKPQVSNFQKFLDKDSNVQMFIKATEIKESEIIAEDNEQLNEIPERSVQPKRLVRPRMSQSIALTQPKTEAKKNDKRQSILDIYVNKKAIQKMNLDLASGVISEVPNIGQLNVLALSIIQPFIQELNEQQA